MKLIVTLVFAVAAASVVHAQDTTGLYTVNQSKSSIGFTIHGSMIFKVSRDGQFKDFTGHTPTSLRAGIDPVLAVTLDNETFHFLPDVLPESGDLRGR